MKVLPAALLAVAVALSSAACGDQGSGEEAGSTADGQTEISVEPLTPAGKSPAGDERLEPIGSFGAAAIEATGVDGSTVCSCVLLADSPGLRSRGLMGVTDLQGWDGMVFTFTEDTTSSFTMRDTPMPLSIAWIAADGSIVSTTDMDPCVDGGDGRTCPSYSASGPYRFALEVPQGGLAERGITSSSRIRFVESCEA